MKKRICLVLCAAVLALSACGAPVYETPAAPTETPAPAQEAADDLTPVLSEIRERMHPGTAGSSLTAAELACALMDWCAATEMDEARIAAATERFLEGRDEQERTEFALQLGAVNGAIDRLLGDGGEGLLDDIGGPEGTGWPWPDAPRGKLDAVLAAARVAELTAESGY